MPIKCQVIENNLDQRDVVIIWVIYVTLAQYRIMPMELKEPPSLINCFTFL